MKIKHTQPRAHQQVRSPGCAALHPSKPPRENKKAGLGPAFLATTQSLN
jgi:hypothetical protein